MTCQARLSDFEFSRQEINEAVRNKQLLSMEIEFSQRCNFQCPYCYVPQTNLPSKELTQEEICSCILQAKELGAKKIIILGGEPMIYPQIIEMIEFIRNQGMGVEMFTNGFGITSEIARKLISSEVNVVLKMNSFKEDVQDKLTGISGSYKIIQGALANLKQAGYPYNGTFLGISTIICKQNIDEIIPMWRWLREQKIVPYFEIITPQGQAIKNHWLDVEPKKLGEIFHTISEIDHKIYGRQWKPQPPLVGSRCLRHQFSCLVTAYGDVMPCVGVSISVGNIRQRRLSDIVKDSEIIQELRDYQKNIKGPCKTCDMATQCYGCRGAAYQLTGDYMASDPLCWKNLDKMHEIEKLPLKVDKLIPQKLPMRIVDTLTKVEERTAEVCVKISRDMPFVGDDGLLDESAYMELIAQGCAAFNSFKQSGNGKLNPQGLLLGAKNLTVNAKAKVGDTLRITVFKYEKFGDFGLIKGTVWRNGDILASGEIKVWHDTKGDKF
jgi:radical SAM protein with 4Fe4S-binding SPASM domain